MSRLIERRTGCLFVRGSILIIYAISGQLDKTSLYVCPWEPRHTYQVAQCAIYPSLLLQFVQLPCDLRLLGRGSSHVSVLHSDMLALLLGSTWPPLRGGLFCQLRSTNCTHLVYRLLYACYCQLRRSPIYMVTLHSRRFISRQYALAAVRLQARANRLAPVGPSRLRG